MVRRAGRREFRFPFRRREDVRSDIQEEFEFHLVMRTEELMRLGLSETEASARARREFGDRRSGEEGCAAIGSQIERKRHLSRVIEEARQDIASGFRQIARNPGLAAMAIATLAIALAANTAIFAVVNALVFKPLPVAAPDELARIKAGETQMAWANFEDMRRANTVFSGMAAYRRLMLGLASDDRSVRVQAQQTTGNFFSVLGVRAAIGRSYVPSDSRLDLVVLSHRMWRSHFASDPSLVGRALTLGGRPYEVVGIMPPDFRAVDPPGLAADLWLPVGATASDAILRDRTESAFEVVGRLRPGVTHAQAQAALTVFAQRLRGAYPEIHESFVRVSTIPVSGIRAFEGLFKTLLPVFAFLGVLIILSGIVLLIGCANIAGLLLGRAASRRSEIAMRLTLGAGRGRLIRQLLLESFVLAVIGGAAGLILAGWLAATANALIVQLPLDSLDLRADGRVLLYAAGLTLVTTLVFGLAPARGGSRIDIVSSLKDTSTGATGGRRFRRMLVVGQVGATAALLIWSGLFIRSLSRIADVDPGFDSSGVLLAGVGLERGTEERGMRLLADLQQRVLESPGVQGAGLAKIVPLSMRGREEFDIAITDSSGQPSPRRVTVNTLSPGWFKTVRIEFVAGRDFGWDDRPGTPRVVIVNETLARQFWNGDAIGRQILDNRQPVQVIGVVRDSKYWTLGETIVPTIYLPLLQRPSADVALHVRTADARATGTLIASELRRMAPEIAVEIEPMSEAVAVAALPARVGAAATTAFGVVAMLLSALGIYGLVSFAVVQRTREIGIRKALGAQTTDVIYTVVGGIARLTISGLAGGLVVGVLGGMALRGFIFGVSPFDGATLVGAAAVVLASALLASALPAIAAARVDPMIPLRNQ